MGPSSYKSSGVRSQAEALSSVTRHLASTFEHADGEVIASFGHYASALKITDDLAVAICTDGVGSKTLIASALARYDTIGFDCIAMNVNDLICIGAKPLALVDYIGVHSLDQARTDGLLQGLGAAAKEAAIAIPGGEIAQLPEVLSGEGGDGGAFDLVGTCVGTLHPADLNLGRATSPGDAIIGLASSGIHSNGLSLARRVLLGDAKLRLDDHIASLGRTLGEELLEPTTIYVRAVSDLWSEGIAAHGLAHITGDGLLNLLRLEAEVGYAIDELPARPAIFDLIQQASGIAPAEMFEVFNMGVGFVVVVPDDDAGRALERLARSGISARRIGVVTEGPRRVMLVQEGLVATVGAGHPGWAPA